MNFDTLLEFLIKIRTTHLSQNYETTIFLATITTMECIKMILRLNCVTNKIYTSSKSELYKLISKQINFSPHLII